ncbi:MAG: hypothetical protein ABW217_23240 [Polyangiaceae bacterium]
MVMDASTSIDELKRRLVAAEERASAAETALAITEASYDRRSK